MLNLVIFLFATQLWAAKCGFDVLMQHREAVKQGLARPLALRTSNANACTDDDLIDTHWVRVDTTTHFRIAYTLKGPHAVIGSDTVTGARPAYIDSLMLHLEHAYLLHTDTIGMRAPKGPAVTYQYHIADYPNKFGVEVIDIDHLRNINNVLGGLCGGCYGLTLPDTTDPSLSTLFLDNDFRYQNAGDPTSTYTTSTGKTCTYTPSVNDLTDNLNGKNVDYSISWDLAQRVTAVHEMYHTCQLRYANVEMNYSFWVEASAVGVEDLGAPDVNDYFQYLPQIFSAPQTSMLSYADGMHQYGECLFYHYLVHRFGLRFDPGTWELMAASPSRSIDSLFNDHFLQVGITGGFPDVFADHAEHISFANKRSAYLPADSIWDADLSSWPAMALSDFSRDSFPTDPFSFRLYYSSPTLAAWTLPSGYKRVNFTLGDTSFTLLSVGFAAGSNSAPTTVLVAKAYPVPWRGLNKSDSLHFELTNADPWIEVRDMAGHQIAKLKHELSSTTTGWDGTVNGRELAPGVYYWRGSGEKTMHRFLVIR